jgi:uncharacterized membrane protein YcfT
VAAWRKNATGAVWLAAITAIIAFIFWDKSTYVYISGMKLSWDNSKQILLRFIAGISLSLVFLQFAWILHMRAPSRLLAPLNIFGNNSLHIYLIHGYLLTFLEKIAIRHDFVKKLLSGSSIAILSLLAIIIAFTCIVTGYILQRTPLSSLLLLGRLKNPNSR